MLALIPTIRKNGPTVVEPTAIDVDLGLVFSSAQTLDFPCIGPENLVVGKAVGRAPSEERRRQFPISPSGTAYQKC